MANYESLKAAVQAVIKTNGNNEITGAILQSTLLSLINSIGDDYLFAGVATPSTNPGSPDQNVFYIGGAGVYANFGTSITVPDGSICAFKYNGSWTKELCNVGSGAFNVSKANAVDGVYATYSTLSDALNAVPSSSRQGGMTIIYIDEDSQDYVQYRLMNKNWSTNVKDWQGVDDEPTSGSKNLVKSDGVFKNILEVNQKTGKIHVSSAEAYIGWARLPFKIYAGKPFVFTLINKDTTFVGIGENGANLFLNGGLAVNTPVSITSNTDAEFIKCYNSSNSKMIASFECVDSINKRLKYFEEGIQGLATGFAPVVASAYSDYSGFARIPFTIKNGVPFTLTLLNRNAGTVCIGENGSNLFPTGLSADNPVKITPDTDATFIKCWIGTKLELIAKFEEENNITSIVKEGYKYIGVATTITNPGTPKGKVFYLTTTAGTYINFDGIVVTDGLNVLKYDGSSWSLEQIIGIDDKPTINSHALSKSGGVAEDMLAVNEESGKIISTATPDNNSWVKYPFKIYANRRFTFTLLTHSTNYVSIGEGPNLFSAHGLDINTPVSICSNTDAEYIKCRINTNVETQASFEYIDSVNSRLNYLEDSAKLAKGLVPITASAPSDYSGFARIPFDIKQGVPFTIIFKEGTVTSVIIGEDGSNLFPGGASRDVPYVITPDRNASFLKCWIGTYATVTALFKEDGNIDERLTNLENKNISLDTVTFNTIGQALYGLKDHNGFVRLPFNVETGKTFRFTVFQFVTFVGLGENGPNLFSGGLPANYPVNITPDRDATFIKCWVGSASSLSAKAEAVDSLNVRTNDNYLEHFVNIGDYSNNLKTLFESISPDIHNHYTILIPEGDYNVKSWYDPIPEGSVGLKIPSYVKLKGVGQRDKVRLIYDNSGETYNNDVSTLNTSGDWNEIENITVISNNIRYAVHDDSHYSKPRYVHCKNCRFICYDSTRAWGAGTDTEYKGIFEDCEFIVEDSNPHTAYYNAFLLHDYSNTANTESEVKFVNCRFSLNVHIEDEIYNSADVGFGFSYGQCNVELYGCDLKNEGLRISNKTFATGYSNHFAVNPVVENPETGVTYLDFISN